VVTPETSNNPSDYLGGSYAPVYDEIDAPSLEVLAGELPGDLAGTFVRNSSNPRFPPKGRYHWFDGDGMLHAVRFGDGRAAYRNRWIRTRAFLAEEEAGETLWTGVTERPDFTNPRGVYKDTANTDVVFHAGKLLATWWLGGEPYVVDVTTLATCGIETFGGGVPTISAHPKVDAVTGEMMIFDYKPLPPYLRYGVVAPDGRCSHWTTVDLPGPRLQHDMAITAHHTILFDMSLMWDPELLARGQTRVRFFRDRPSRVGILPRHAPGDHVRWFETEPFYMYHTINAWEDGNRIVLLGCRITNPLAEDPPSPREGASPTIGFLRLEPALYRWTFDLGTGAVREEQLDDLFAEFPRMDNRVLGRPSRFSYHGRMAPVATMRFDGLVKYDTESGARWSYAYPAGWSGGEVAFAPRIGSRAEDDGYLVTFVADETSGASEVYLFDARDIIAGPVARLAVPQRVPTGYHTWWVPRTNEA
jgi:carotenoid cleavage dioxygenase